MIGLLIGSALLIAAGLRSSTMNAPVAILGLLLGYWLAYRGGRSSAYASARAWARAEAHALALAHSQAIASSQVVVNVGADVAARLVEPALVHPLSIPSSASLSVLDAHSVGSIAGPDRPVFGPPLSLHSEQQRGVDGSPVKPLPFLQPGPVQARLARPPTRH